MKNSLNLITSAKLIPFFGSAIAYFAVGAFKQHGTISSTIFKCLPIYMLMFFILAHGFSLTKEYRHSQLILLGLLFGSIGDVLLNWNYFAEGMLAFGIGHLFYISAFKFRPLNPLYGLIFYGIGVFCVALFIKNLSGILPYALPVYAFLLTTMAWRAVARTDGQARLLPILCGLGAVLFIVSDGLIAFNKFYVRIGNAQIMIMITYYLAQLFIVTSVVDQKLPVDFKNGAK